MQPSAQALGRTGGSRLSSEGAKKSCQTVSSGNAKNGREFSGRARDSVAAPLSFLRGFATYRAFTLGYILAPLRG